MKTLPRPEALEQYVDDELLRAPLVFEPLLEGVLAQARQQRPALNQAERIALDELVGALPGHWNELGARYLGSLREQLYPRPDEPRASGGRLVLELVDEASIALDVELSRTVDALRSQAEAELRDLQAYLAAMVGDMDIADDHNPLHPAVHARALRAAAQGLPLGLKHHCLFIRCATPPFAQSLREAYAASCARFEEMGVEPASHRTVLMPDGTRRLQVLHDVTYVPDLGRLRDALPPTVRRSLSRAHMRRLASAGAASAAAAPAAGEAFMPGSPSAHAARPGHVAPPTVNALLHPGAGVPGATALADRQAVELVHRLFKAFAFDERIPADVVQLIARLRGPAMRLTLRDPSVLDRREHPLWSLIHLLAYHAEMVPDVLDPERRRWLALGEQTIGDLASKAVQQAAAYQAAVECLEAFVAQRLERRCAALAPQVQALRRTEAGLAAADAAGEGAVLDTVPAALLPRGTPPPRTPEQALVAARAWLDGLVPGQWLRLLLKGRWVHAQLLWVGERGRIVLVGDGASEATWALRRPVLLTLHQHGLAKTLQVRALVGAAAMRVQEQLSLPAAA